MHFNKHGSVACILGIVDAVDGIDVCLGLAVGQTSPVHVQGQWNEWFIYCKEISLTTWMHFVDGKHCINIASNSTVDMIWLSKITQITVEITQINMQFDACLNSIRQSKHAFSFDDLNLNQIGNATRSLIYGTNGQMI